MLDYEYYFFYCVRPVPEIAPKKNESKRDDKNVMSNKTIPSKAKDSETSNDVEDRTKDVEAELQATTDHIAKLKRELSNQERKSWNGKTIFVQNILNLSKQR